MYPPDPDDRVRHLEVIGGIDHGLYRVTHETARAYQA